MTVHLLRELEKIKGKILKMGTLAEEAIDKATRSVIDLDLNLAQEVMDTDNVMDELEIDIEEDCLKALALYQPVAIDLRYIVAVMKINSDLERMGDLSYNIARRVRYLEKGVELGFNFEDLAGKVRIMVGDSLSSLLNKDSKLARKVLEEDDEVDKIKKDATDWVEAHLADDPSKIGSLMRYLTCVRNLERIGDLATNIAEDVIYMAEGKIVRHQMEGMEK